EAELGLELFVEGTDPGIAFTRRTGLGNRHQAPQPQPRQSRHRPGQRLRFMQRDARLGPLGRSIHLNKDIQRRELTRALLRQSLCNFFTIDRLYPLETLRYDSRLVTL